MKTQTQVSGTLGYLLLWIGLPLFQLAIAGLIYSGARPGLIGYAVIGSAANIVVINMLYFVGQILDEERLRGTLAGLFLTPAPRVGWLSGFALAGGFQMAVSTIVTVVFGWLVFGISFHVNWPALVLSAVLLLFALWGLGFVFSAIGLWCKRSNDVSNLLSPIFALIGGVFYPLSVLPPWLRLPGEILPIPYGVQALVGATLKGESVTSLGGDLIPLAIFAVVLPVVGIACFRMVERLARRQGQLDLY
jgi:ABC-2 type transport system permease protein